jgi:methylated-DNA-[protein]-cysteine S-methyltransferase
MKISDFAILYDGSKDFSPSLFCPAKNAIIVGMKPQKQYEYAIFKTRWGWFGLLGTENGLIRTCLPVDRKEALLNRMLSDVLDAKQSKTPFSVLETRIQDYYKGQPIDFSDVDVCLDGLSDFQQHVLTTLRKVTYGKTVSYGQLARMAGSPKAARAIGSVMAANPLSLIIPCHRVIRTDRTVGMFTAPGGTKTKKRLLELEKAQSSPVMPDLIRHPVVTF